MITEVTLENFKSHRHTHLKFDDSRLHAIVGQNSVGKTSILEAILYLTQVRTTKNAKFFSNERSPENLISIGKIAHFVMIKWLEEGEKEFSLRYSLEDIYSRNPYFEVEFDKIRLHPTDEIPKWIKRQYIDDIDDSQRGTVGDSKLIQIIDKTKYLKIDPVSLSRPDYSESITPSVTSNGSGLPSVLDFVRDEDYGQFKKIENMLKMIVPTVKKLGVRRAKVKVSRQRSIQLDDGTRVPYQEEQELIGKEVVLDMQSGDRIPGHALSEGTLLTLGLLTVLMSPNRPNLILLDDIQQGLHPKAQRELMTVIQEIIKENPELQIIFTTHSPYIIDELKPSQVHVLHSDAEGFTLSKRLDEHPDVDWAMQTLTTGEFWGAEGEEWVMTAPDGELEQKREVETQS